MLMLWSRALRTPRTCRCIQCVSNTSAIARRTRPSGTPTSTFTYTAIFTAGIAIDGRAKLQRNKQWDEAFAGLREESTEPPTTDTQSEHDSATRARSKTPNLKLHVRAGDGITLGRQSYATLEDLSGDGLDWTVIGQIAGTELDEDEVFDERLSRGRAVQYISQDLWQLLEIDSRFPGAQAMEWPVNTGPDLQRKNLAPQSLWSYDAVREKALRRRHTWKKLSLQQLSTALLAIGIIKEAHQLQPSLEAASSLSPTIRDLIMLGDDERGGIFAQIYKGLQDIELLSDTNTEAIRNVKASLAHLPIPHYVQDNDGDFYHICQQMNGNIRRILGNDDALPRHDSNSAAALAEALTKIAHNLLVSTAAPDVQTFNLLIAGFKRWQLSGLVDQTITAFNSCKIRPNELTCGAILDYYIETNQPEHFSNFIERMRGTKNPLMLAKPSVNVNEAGQGRLIRINENKVWQKVHPTPMVFNTMMRGLMRFTGLERSLEIYYELKDDGWGLDMSTLNHFLVECTHQSDWAAGLYIWDEICGMRGKLKLQDRLKQQDMAEAYSNMLSLCSVTGNTTAFNHILSEVVRGRFDSKAILGAATSLAEKVQSKQAQGSPAFTADNLLIAVSDYTGGEEPWNSAKGQEDDSENPFDAGAVQPFDPSTSSASEIASTSANPWDAWLDHELGKKG